MRIFLGIAALTLGLATSLAQAEQRLMLFGGGKRPAQAMERFLKWAGDSGRGTHILVITWASAPPGLQNDLLPQLAPYHPDSMDLAPSAPEMQTSAGRERFLQELQSSTGVFFTGGEQSRIGDVLDATGLRPLLQERFRAGEVFAGTSAGTAVMSHRMPDGEEGSDGKYLMFPGLGLLPEEVYVDTHFFIRKRITRMREILSDGPERVGIGIDEGTAAAITFGNPYPLQVEVLGPTDVLLLRKTAAQNFRSEELSLGDHAYVELPEPIQRLRLAPQAYLEFLANRPLDRGTYPEITSAVLMVHGTLRNADAYFTTLKAAAKLGGHDQDSLLVAPRFETPEDDGLPDDARWKNSAWKEGELSQGQGARLSSYAALDALIAVLEDRSRFPNLRRITVTGHSAGGQVAARYAVAGRAEDLLPDVAFRYVIANPSSYLYLDSRRPSDGEGNSFAVPAAGSCGDFDDYPYGLEHPSEYLSSELAKVAANVVKRDITMLLGGIDTQSDYLDTSCEANLEGVDRLHRGLAYFHYLTDFFAPRRLTLVQITGVGHDHDEMFRSAKGVQALFPSMRAGD